MTEDPPTASDPPVRHPTGSPPGVEALFRERYRPMVSLAYLLVRDATVAEELVQDAFLAVQRRWETIEDPPAYLRTAVVNACRSWGRRQQVRRDHLSTLIVESAPGADAVADELWDALATLPERQRTAVVLRYYEDASDETIAAVLGCRPATVRTTLHRALKALRPHLTPEAHR